MSAQNNVGLRTEEVVCFVAVDQPRVGMMAKDDVNVARVSVEVVKLRGAEEEVRFLVVVVGDKGRVQALKPDRGAVFE
jgi:hypothetical protein